MASFDPAYFTKMHARQGNWCGRTFRWLDDVDSTNQLLKRLSTQEFVHGIVCGADHQTAGRGQRDRTWVSRKGENLLFSVGFEPGTAHALSLFTLSVAHHLAMVLEEMLSLPIRIKWPNDLYVTGRKLAGILTETVFSGSVLDRVIVGVGLNVNQVEFPADIAQSTTSMAQVSGLEWTRETLLSHLLLGMETSFDRWATPEGRSTLPSDIHRRLIGYGEWMQVQIDGVLIGRQKCLGVDSEGRLLLLDADMNVRSFAHQQIRLLPDDEATARDTRLSTPSFQPGPLPNPARE